MRKRRPAVPENKFELDLLSLIAEAETAGTSRDDIISALELALYAQREQEGADE